MTQPPTAGPPGAPKDDLSGDAARIAGGSGIVFAGGMVDRGLRWVLKWYLSGALGPAGLGVYEVAVKLASTITSFSPLGLDTGVVLFASRYARSGERERLKGTLLSGLWISLVMGLVVGAGLFAVATYGPWWQEDPMLQRSMQWMAPCVVAWTPLLYAVGALRAVKDMRRSVLAFQVVLPVLLVASSAVLVGLLGLDVVGAVIALGLSTLVATLAAFRYAWRHFRRVLSDRDLKALYEPGTLLRFSIPQSLTAAAFRLNLYMDVLMLGWLSTREEVGIYAIAASLASFGSIPANAVTSIFNPFIAELVYTKELQRLDRLLKTVTRWLIVVAAPVYLLLFLLPTLVLSIYDEVYMAALVPLVVLVAGQAVNTACAPTMRLIPMAGHSMLNLVNGVVALVLNVGLNWWLIPRYGALGAAMATGATLAAWSLWRVVEVWLMLRCFPFGWRGMGLLVLAGAGAAAVRLLTDGGELARLGATALLVLAFGLVAATVGRTPEDDAVLGRVKARVRRLLGRR